MIRNPCIKCRHFDDYHQTCIKDEVYLTRDDEVYGRRLDRKSKYPQHYSIYKIREEFCKGEDFAPKLTERVRRFFNRLFKGENND